MNETDQTFVKHWGEERTKGKVRFIGIATIMLFVGINIVNLIANYFYMDAGNFVDLLEMRKVPLYLAISVGLGLFKWWRNEKRYADLVGGWYNVDVGISDVIYLGFWHYGCWYLGYYLSRMLVSRMLFISDFDITDYGCWYLGCLTYQ